MTRPLSWPTQQPEPTQQRRHDPAVELAYAATGTYPAGVALAVRLPYPALPSSTQLYAALRSNWNLPSNVGMTRPVALAVRLPYPALRSSTQQPEPTQQRRHDPAVELAYAATGTYPAGVALAVRLPYPALPSSTQLYAATGTYPATSA